MDSIKPGWKKRGYASEEEISLQFHKTDNELIELLKSKEAVKRTVAATILGQRKNSNLINVLCQALKTEKALYSKIAITEALGQLGGAAANELILLFGKIGKNQHRTPPEKLFEKWNYPLPRDIAARTITKIGETALNPILESIGKMSNYSLSEAIDAIGFISFYSGNKSAFHAILELLDLYKPDDLIVWKIIRCLQSFPSPDSEKILVHYLIHHKQPSIRWEAARSLAQICRKVPDSIISATKDNNELVRKMSSLAKSRILRNNI
jgi:HEAT repeat protein